MQFFFKKTLFLGKRILFMPSCLSTNDIAASYSMNIGKKSHGHIVLSDYQTDGKGQRGSTWESRPGQNLMLSIILFPDKIYVQNQFMLSVITVLALRDTVQNSVLIDTFVKWPNDIYVDHKKIAGVLIENTLKSSKISRYVIGIGLNVNQSSFSSPQATSLSLISKGTKFDKKNVLEYLLLQFEKWYALFQQDDDQVLWSKYHEYLYEKNTCRNFVQSDGKLFKGQILGVDRSGLIEIMSDNQKKKFNTKEVSLLF